MNETARVSCCIVGCRRTFKRPPNCDACDEFMCSKHYRCDRELVAKHRRRRAQVRKWYRRCMGHAGPATFDERRRFERMERIWTRWVGLSNATWADIKAQAQLLQDQGFWARPVKRRVGSGPKTKPSPLARGFEAEFQRAKARLGA